MHLAHLHWLSEHRSLSAVLSAMRQLSATLAAPCHPADLRALRAMLLYLSDYPERVHHAQEESQLFSRLQGRDEALDDTLQRLHRQHGNSLVAVHRLEHLLNRAEFGQSTDVSLLRHEIVRFIASYYEHMRLEEQGVLPAAEALLNDAEWGDMADALAHEHDPLHAFSNEARYEELLSTIVRLTPAPLGLADPHEF